MCHAKVYFYKLTYSKQKAIFNLGIVFSPFSPFLACFDNYVAKWISIFAGESDMLKLIARNRLYFKLAWYFNKVKAVMIYERN